MKQFAHDLEKLQQIYTLSSDAVRAKGFTQRVAENYYSNYINFVVNSTPRHRGRLLDVGCGNGWSSYLFAKCGYEVTGVELNPGAFEPPPLSNLTLQRSNAMELPFSDGSFDVVASYQMLEHIPHPKAALLEMLRVAKSGGTISIVSPNLLSILASFRGVTSYVWRNRPLNTIIFRTPGMPHHPCGNTLPELGVSLLGNVIRLTAKVVSKYPQFSMREPELNPPFHSDNDACYLCNPVDLIKFFRLRECRVLQNGRSGRPPLSWLVATGTYVTVQKPEGPSPLMTKDAATICTSVDRCPECQTETPEKAAANGSSVGVP